jgi:hypothetical protein
MDRGKPEQSKPDETEPRVYVLHTLRATAVLAIIAIGLCWRYAQIWAILPFLTGLAMAIILFAGWYLVISQNVTPKALKKNNGMQGRKVVLFLFALIKYPLVTVLLWFVVHNGGTREVLVFIGGFLFLQMVMVLRAVGKMLTEKIKTQG